MGFKPLHPARVEHSEWLAIETGVTGNAQESDFMNGTLQGTGSGEDDFEFTVQTHIGIPASVTTEEALAEYLADVLGKVTALNLGIAFDVQVGPHGDGEDEDEDEDDE